jgi:hypothetical protein
MKYVKGLYFHVGQLHCPVHGHAHIKFGSLPEQSGLISWWCSATMPDGTGCQNHATWSSIASIGDPDVRTLAVTAMNAARKRRA